MKVDSVVQSQGAAVRRGARSANFQNYGIETGSSVYQDDSGFFHRRGDPGFSMTVPAIKKMAESQVIRQLPKPYSPMHEMSNIQLPRDLVTLNAWCLVPEARVLMADGTLKCIKDVQIGEKVITHLGNVKEVVNKFVREVDEDICEIYVPGLRNPLCITANHEMWAAKKKDVTCIYHDAEESPPWCCNEKRTRYCKKHGRYESFAKSFNKIRAGDLEARDTLTSPICREIREPKNLLLKNPDFLRLLGYYLAEGCICAKDGINKGVCFTIGLHEVDTLGKNIINIIESVLKIKAYAAEVPSSYDIRFADDKYASLFYKHCGRYSGEKRLSDDLLYLDPQLQKHLVVGYLEGDGHQVKEGIPASGIIEFGTKSKDLAEQLCFILSRLEIPAYLYVNLQRGGVFKDKNGNPYGIDHDFYHVKFRSSHVNVFAEISQIFKTVEKNGFTQKRKLLKDHFVFKITKLNKVHYAGKVYNIEVADDHSYVVEGIGLFNSRHHFDTNPMVKNAILLHSAYPISQFELTCDSREIKEFFNEMLEELDFYSTLLSISTEYWKLGEAFPFGVLDVEEGKWSKFVVHNPDYIDVKTNVLAGESVISLRPDETLRRIITSSRPVDVKLRNQLPPRVIYHVLRGENIPLDNFNISHLKMMSSPYDTRGTPLITCVFKDLMLYDKIREAKYAQADNLINPITLVKLGDMNGSYRPTDTDLKEFRDIMEQAQYDLDFKIITHGCVTIDRIGANASIMDTSNDMQQIERNLLTGLLVPEVVARGEGSNYATASVALEILYGRYTRFRNIIERWMVKKVIEPISKINRFYDPGKGSTKKLIVPKVIWDKRDIRITQDYLQLLQGLLEGDRISEHAIFRPLDIDWDENMDLKRTELIQKAIMVKETEILSQMTVEELRAIDPKVPIKSKEPSTAPSPIPGIPGSEGEGGGLPGLPGMPPPGGGGPTPLGMPPGGEGGLMPEAPTPGLGAPAGGGASAPV